MTNANETVTMKDQYLPILRKIDTATKKVEKVRNTYAQRRETLLEKLDSDFAEKIEAAEAELAEAKKELANLTATIAGTVEEQDAEAEAV